MNSKVDKEIIPIFIPQDALASGKTFTDWFYFTHNQLFEKEIPIKNERNELPASEEECYVLLEKIMKETNYIFTGSLKTFDWKNKKKKYDSTKGGIIGVTIYIMMNYYDCTYNKLGTLLNLNHSTVVYYVKKTNGYMQVKSYKTKYLQILTKLQHERVIPIAKTKKLKSKLVLYSLQLTE